MQQIIESLKNIALEIDKNIKYGEQIGKNTSTNASGEQQIPLDILSDAIVQKHLKNIDNLKILASEEHEEVIAISDSGNICIAYDPLDGSSLADVNLSVGSIFGVYKNSFSGKNLVAAAYIVYGPKLQIVFSDSESTKLYTAGKNNSFREEIVPKLNGKKKILAPGGSNKHWFPEHRNWIDSLWNEGYRLRYSGGMVPDIHHIIMKRGGIFCYPPLKNAPNGKLRKLFEVFPFAFIFEQLGGKAYDGENRRLLELETYDIHERTSCFFVRREEK